MQVLGIDIGGANIKAATADGESRSVPFAIWKSPERLVAMLQELRLPQHGVPDLVALTMTAELADCFQTRAEGVEFIIRAVTEVYPKIPVRIWLTSGEFAEPEDAIDLAELAAAANWHALATWAGRAVPVGPALLIDVGSTTTDIIPLIDGVPMPAGLTDLQRLQSAELVYTGVRRTPVCAIVQRVPLQPPSEVSISRMIPVAAELFATALDVHLLAGDIPENPDETDTADGRPALRSAALNRLAHQICCDTTDLTETQILAIARFVSDSQVQQIVAAIREQLATLRRHVSAAAQSEVHVILSGSGGWLAEKALSVLNDRGIASVTDLSSMFIRNVSACAPAFAVARLAAERCMDDLLPLSTLLQTPQETP